MEDLISLFYFLLGSILLIILLIIPLVLTCFNIYNLFARSPVREDLVDGLTFVLGPAFMALLWAMWSAPDWDVPLYTNMEPFFHAPLASWHLPTLLVLVAWAWLSCVLIRFQGEKLPPLPAVMCLSGIEAGSLLSLIFLLQLFPHLARGVFAPFDVAYMLLFPLNVFLCVPRFLRRFLTFQTQCFQSLPPSQKPLPAFCRRILSHSLGWMGAGFLLAVPLLTALTALLVLFGQAPDAAVRAFTETSDWTFSQMIPPPPIEYHGHYLCTVAAEGHPRLVKPIRKGLRHGWPILVNRQLCIANAFEQLLMERLPRLHRAVRDFYDAHGYPFSKKITTPLRADMIYLLMKPLEWVFLLCLYTFDQDPETRIALQYTGR